jgi:hypothetical protein
MRAFLSTEMHVLPRCFAPFLSIIFFIVWLCFLILCKVLYSLTSIFRDNLVQTSDNISFTCSLIFVPKLCSLYLEQRVHPRSTTPYSYYTLYYVVSFSSLGHRFSCSLRIVEGTGCVFAKMTRSVALRAVRQRRCDKKSLGHGLGSII